MNSPAAHPFGSAAAAAAPLHRPPVTNQGDRAAANSSRRPSMASQVQAKKAIAEHRMKRHKVICFFGAALIMWTVCQCSPTAAQAVTWNGSLQTFLFIIILFHLRMIELYGVLGGSRTA
ncbi:unnamed protein product [Urochloa humidicola]